ncbi:NAD-binding protein [Streptomyces sp. BE303]|uniref:NAD-binding protein n=1 Tax=Streptomyces sp. BE303 TaxID=3002528 RepID=UPI002E786BF3|nr:NAD-binding protein [Streptomyces sp. BE303]MED7952423.1 NAD-binding protein [Streptomyces sp. BE303]
MTSEGWGTPPVEPISQHYIVCGGNALAHRLTLELVEHYEVPVVVLVPDRTRDHAPQIEQLDGVAAVVEYAGVTEEALRAVRVETARGIALVEGRDQENIHAALSAQGNNPDIRIVLRMFNQRLGENIERLLRNGTALSGSATAAPAFAAAALSRPNSVQVGDRFLHIAYDDDIDSHRICVVADRIDRQDLGRTRLLPEQEGDSASFVRLAREFGDDGPIRSGAAARRAAGAEGAAGTPGSGDGDTGREAAREPAAEAAEAAESAESAEAVESAEVAADRAAEADTAAREVAGVAGAAAEGRGGVAALQTLPSEPPVRIAWWRRLRWRLLDTLRFFTSARLRLVLITALAAVLLAFGLLWYLNRDFGWSLYVSLLDLAGAAQPDQPADAAAGTGTGGTWQRIAQVVITFCGITFAPVATAIMVEVLASGRRGQPRNPGAGTRDHVIVIGLGNVGTRVVAQLHGLGVPVVGLERDPQARGISAVRALGVPVVVDDGPLAEQLRRARLKRSRAVVAVSGDDATNLEAALEARAVRPDVRVVVRLFDDNFAHHVYATLDNAASRSTSYLSAPAFAAALMGREVLGTLSVFRHVLLIAELRAEVGSGLIGLNRHDLEDPGGVRVLAVRLARSPQVYHWNYADRTRGLEPGDRVVVAATRSGLARLNTVPGNAGGGRATAEQQSDR